jgi:sulfate adenylyltransferase subunit 2
MILYQLNHLKELESEAIYIIRETASQFERPVLLFSGGKDSIVMTHLARKAFSPARIPFPLMHIDTGHNFPETLDYRDRMVKAIGANLIVKSVQESIDKGRAKEEKGPNASRNVLQTVTLLDAIAEFKFDAALGGARRDEEKARAKERFFSHRDEFGQWDPKNQRPELWNILNGKKNIGEHFRVFPLSNWTEMDVWQYIQLENLSLPEIYFSHDRVCFHRDGMILSQTEHLPLRENEKTELMRVRYRTVGDMTCTAAVLSPASTVLEIIEEIAASRTTERGSRADDKRSEAAMEDRKKQGYF